MRVLHVSSGNLYGGVETLLLTLARCRHLCPEMDTHFALCFEGRLSVELRATGVPVHFLGNARASRPWTIWRARRELRNTLTDIKFDAIVCHMPWSLAIFGSVAEASERLVFWMHGLPNHRWLDRWASTRKPHLAICASDFTVAALPAVFPHTPASLIRYPVALPTENLGVKSRTQLRKRLNIPESAVVIIQVSRMEPWKGHLIHLHALARLTGLPEWVCLFAGGAHRPAERQYVKRLEETVTQMGIAGRVRFLGECPDVPDLLQAADIFCQPNEQPEPFGIVFIEALLAGLPVVTSAIGGGLEIVDESCGRLVPLKSAPALADTLHQLIKSPALRARLASAGPARAAWLCDPERQLGRLKEALAN